MAMLSGKPLASLSSGLLARKGQAKPAMRPQGFGGFASSPAAALDDLGWNDMDGGDQPAAAPLPVPAAPTFIYQPLERVEPVPMPPVVALREALKEEIEQSAEPAPEQAAEPSAPPVELRPVSVATAARISRESAKQTAKAGKAAFTLRLDADRHLRLRLASALNGRSAQLLVTGAVDAMLETMPEVAALVAQLPEPKHRR